MAAKKPVQDMTIASLERQFILAPYWLGGTYSPAVLRVKTGYRIRVYTAISATAGSVTTSYDYFDLDNDGLVTAAPRGRTRDFKGRVRITDIVAAVAWHADPVNAKNTIHVNAY